ncbi:MAG TPA: DUF2334 domain-containing protein [Candidatus Nanoarchaeia archaeon]|nr:DUF2334 domain-containing protein [Candidatus Nanoarchaeia archaeon]
MKKKKIIILILFVFILLILSLLITRIISPKEIDDITPEIPCASGDIEKSDVLWVVPKYNNHSISENKEWCNSILSLNKTLGMHGIYHNFNEFDSDKNQEDIKEGMKIFEECFLYEPTMFKPPQLKINEYNKGLIEEENLKLKLNFNQLIHKVYHCNDTGLFSNRFIDFF